MKETTTLLVASLQGYLVTLVECVVFGVVLICIVVAYTQITGKEELVDKVTKKLIEAFYYVFYLGLPFHIFARLIGEWWR